MSFNIASIFPSTSFRIFDWFTPPSSSQCFYMERNLLSIASQLAEYQRKYCVKSCCNPVAVEKVDQTRARFESGCDSGYSAPSMITIDDVHTDSEEDVEDQIRQMLLDRQQIPYRDYICHRCHVKGHMIQNCPTKNPSMEPTTYQGDRRSIGHFSCKRCHRKWVSKNCFRNESTNCKNCGHAEFPSKMFAMPRS